jgi:repressor LexA
MMGERATHCGALAGGLFVAGQNLGERLKDLREERGMSQAELAKLVGVTRAAVGMYEQGKRSPDYDTLRRFAEVFMVSTDYLLGLPDEAIPVGPTVRLPIVGVIRAGEPIYAEENLEGYEEVPADQVRDGRYFFLRVNGDSMIESRIQDGDLVLVREQNTVANGEIAVVMVNAEEACLKRVYRAGGQLILKADNPKYPPLLAAPHEARIIGKVVEVRFRPR